MSRRATAARLSETVYTMPENRQWTTVNRRTRVCSAEMSQNLIGDNGTIQVAYEVDRDTLYISYSGTEDPENWLYNIEYKSVSYYGYRMHEGFLQLSLEALTALLRGGELHRAINVNGINSIVHCGHSAGGAVAGIMPILLSLHEYDTEVIDFGCPKYLQEDQATFAELPYRRTRFVNNLDVVPKLPLLGRYKHFGETVDITDGSCLDYLKALKELRILREVIDQHSMTRYGVAAQLEGEK
jgi:predicted lipase